MSIPPESFAIKADQIFPEIGHAWTVPVPQELGPSDASDAPTQSTLRLFEDGRRLAPAHSLHAAIRERGGGAYSHWNGTLFFSTPDGSDPRRNGRSYSLARVIDGPYPSMVGIETINTCNARCPFCPLFQGTSVMDRSLRPAKIMDRDTFERCIDEIRQWPEWPTIYLNMNGEPLQDPLFVERVDFISRHGLGPLVSLQTNAQYLSGRSAEAILLADIGRITIGFDGASKTVYEQHRVRCDYDRVLANIREFVSRREEMNRRTSICIQYVHTRRNHHELQASYDMFAAFLDPELDYFYDTLARDWGDKAGFDDLFLIPKRIASAPKGCPTLDSQLIIHSDGTVAACCWDYNLGVSDGGFGNINDAELLDIWRGPARRELRARLDSGNTALMPEKCRDCPNTGAEAIDPSLAAITDERLIVGPVGFMYRFKS